MDGMNDYLAWKEREAKSKANASALVVGAQTDHPDEVAGDIRLSHDFARATGNPPPPRPLVSEYRNEFQRRIEEVRNSTILSSSPRLAEWLRNPENAAVARDDLQGLSWWETGLKATGNALERGFGVIPQVSSQFFADTAKQRADDASRGFGEIVGNEMGQKLIPGPGDLFMAVNRWGLSRIAPAVSGDQRVVAEEFQRRAGEAAKRIAEIPMSPAGSRFRDALSVKPEDASARGQFMKFANDVAADPGGALAFLMETAVQSVPMMGAATAATVATRNPAAGAAVMGATSYAQERGTTPVDFFREKGIDVSTPEGARAALSDPTLIAEAAKRGETRGLIIGALDGLSGGIAGKQLAASHAGNMLLQMLTQAGLGAAGEAAGQYYSGQELSLQDIIIEGLAEFATAPVEVAGASYAKYADHQAKARAAEGRQALFQELAGQSVNSRVRERLPEAFRSFVEEATKDGPVENVFIPGGEFAKYFQGQGIDPFELVDTLEGVSRDDLEAAMATGGDIKVPTATYAARMAGSPHDAFLMQNMRFHPDDMTAREAQEFNARAQEVMQEAWDLAEQQRIDDEATRSHEREIYDTMVSRLREAGRSTDVATNEAAVWSAFYSTMAARNGMTTEEMMRAYPLPKVAGTLPQGMQFKSVDDLTRAVAAARKGREAKPSAGPSLLEFIADRGGIIDPGGELKARDAEVVSRGKGRKALRLARTDQGDMLTTGRKHGADEVARAAVEAGYMTDDPAVHEYMAAMAEGREAPDLTRALWAAIDRELRGDKQRAAGDAAEMSKLDDIERYLNEIGVGLDSTDEQIRAAYDASRQYAQRAYHGSPHKFDAFSMDRIGSGEGAAAFGYGLYFAGKKEVAEYYRDKLGATYRTNDEMRWGGKTALQHYEAADRRGEYGKMLVLKRIMLHEPRNVIEEALADGVADGDRQAIEGTAYLKTLPKEAFPRVDGRLFTVEIPDDTDLLLFDKPMASQPQKVKEIMKSSGLLKEFKDNKSDFSSPQDTRGKLLGQNLYSFLSWKLGGDKAASERLRDLGIPGHKYPAGTIANVSGKGSNYVIYDDANVSVKSYEQNTGGQRGSLSIGSGGIANGDSLIRLFERADLSTVLHESGHYFLAVMQDLAAKGEAASSADVTTIKEWWRANTKDVIADARKAMPDVALTSDDVTVFLDTGTTGDVMKDGAIDVGTQEQFARALETYFMEGKAPSIALRSAFEKFRAWLLSVYRKLAGLNVTVSDDVRAVFDRMLATDEEIAAAKSRAGDTGPVFASAEQMGLTPEQFGRLMDVRAKAEDDAKAKLLGEIMAPLKREQEKWFRDERAKVRDEVEGQVNAMPVFRALEWLGNRRWLGETVPANPLPDARLSKRILVERYGEGITETLPRGKQTLYAVDGGVDPDVAAGWFGFDSGDQMVKALEAAPKRIEAIEAETDRVMRDRHGDPLNDGSVAETALEAVHGDRKAEWLATELKAIADVAEAGRQLTAKEARAVARDTLNRSRVRDAMNASRYLAAERKAGEEAAKLGAQLAREKVWLDAAKRKIETTARAAARGAGDPNAVAPAIDAFNEKFDTTTTSYEAKPYSYTDQSGKVRNVPGGTRTVTSLGYNDKVAALIDAKRRQLLNHALYSEARKIADEVEKAENYVTRLNKPSTRERIAGAGRRDGAVVDYLAAIDDILDRYDFRRLSAAAEARRGALAAFVDRMKEEGRENELAIPDAVLADAGRKPYKTVTVEELRGVVDSLKNLEHIAKRWDKLIDAQNERKLSEASAEIVQAFDANMPKREPGRVNSAAEKRHNAVRAFLDLALNTNTMLREIDGFADQGAAWRNLKRPIDEAENRLIIRKVQAAADLDRLYSPYSKEERRRMAVREFVPEIGSSLSKWEMISVALNMGNEGNASRLMDKRVRGSFTADQVASILGRLDARDARFVQSVWDYLETFRADISARERRVTGTEPAWVDARPITIAGEELRGGYYPIKYDARLGGLSADFAEVDIAQAVQGGRFGKAQTRNGHLKARAEAGIGSVDLDPSVFHRHVNQVMYDLEMSEAVSNTWRLLHDTDVRAAFADAGRAAEFKALEVWLKDVAEGQLKSADVVGSLATSLKSNFTAAKLAFNLANVIGQVAGLSQSMMVVGRKDFAVGVAHAFRNGVREDIASKSPFMSMRQTTFNKDVFEYMTDPSMGPMASRWGDFKRDYIAPLSFWLMTKVQWHLVDVPTWLAGYHQGLRRFSGDERAAIEHADNLVKRAQASGMFADRSAIERGSLSNTNRQNAVIKLFTTLASYMFAKFNVAYERTAMAGRVMGENGVSMRSAGEALSYSLDMAFLFMVDAVIMAAIRGKLPSQDDDEQDEQAAWAKFLAKETAFSALGTVPFVRDITSILDGFDAGGAYGSILSDVAKPVKTAIKAGEEGEVTRQFVKSVINATGLATGAPAVQINRMVDAAWRDSDGEDVSPLEYLLGRRGNSRK